MLLKILKFPDPFLRKKANPVIKVNQKIKKLTEDLWETMLSVKGVGLASIQVGRPEKVCVVGLKPYRITLINPKIVKKTGSITENEGCLSFPGLFLPIERAKKVKVEGLNPQGKKILVEEEGLLARALQQELDHLEGILIIDRVPLEVLKNILDELEKKLPEGENKIELSLINAIRKEKGI